MRCKSFPILFSLHLLKNTLYGNKENYIINCTLGKHESYVLSPAMWLLLRLRASEFIRTAQVIVSGGSSSPIAFITCFTLLETLMVLKEVRRGSESQNICLSRPTSGVMTPLSIILASLCIKVRL